MIVLMTFASSKNNKDMLFSFWKKKFWISLLKGWILRVMEGIFSYEIVVIPKINQWVLQFLGAAHEYYKYNNIKQITQF